MLLNTLHTFFKVLDCIDLLQMVIGGNSQRIKM